MGDFNAKIGSQQLNDNAVGKFGYGERNERGDTLVEFAEHNNLFLMNSFYKKKVSRKWTWKGPNGIKNEIDFILSNNKNVIQDVSVLHHFNTGSDHRLVRCVFKMNIKLERIKLTKKVIKFDLDALKRLAPEFKIELKNKFSMLEELEDTQNVQELNAAISNTILDATSALVGKCINRPDQKLSQKTKNLMKKRREMKISGNAHSKIEYIELCKTVRKGITEDIRAFNCKLVRKTLENNRSIKKTNSKLIIGKNQLIAVKKPDGTVIRNRENIVQVVAEFYKNLYDSKDSTMSQKSEDGAKDVPHILSSEVDEAIRRMKNGKSPGDDGISIDVLKLGGEELSKVLLKLFNKCLLENNIPDDWNNAIVILIHKKGDKEDLRNYRPISLLSVLYKIFTKILSNRLEKILDSSQPREQAGFRKGFNTMDHIQVVREVIERCNEYKQPLCIAFIDFEKAFDSVSITSVLDALKNQGIEQSYIELIRNIYAKATSIIRLHKDSEKINIKKGVRQGDTMSPMLFTAVLEEVFKTLNWENTGLNINGVYLNHLRFADDITVVTNSLDDIQLKIQQLSDASAKVGLKMNLAKTKIVLNKFVEMEDVIVDGNKIEVVEEYIYLGQLQSGNKNMFGEINRRTKMGWSAFGKLNSIFKSNMPLCLKRKVFDQCILPVITYGCETWSLNSKMIQKLRVTQRGMERCMLGISKRDRERNVDIRAKTKISDIIVRVKKLKWNWAGHIARRQDRRWTKEILDWYPRDQVRPRGRPNTRWIDEIRQFAGIEWMRIAEDRTLWKQRGEAFILQWIDNG